MKLQEWLDILREKEKKDEALDDWRDQGPEVMEKHAVEIDKLEAERGSLENRIQYLKSEAYGRGEDPKARAEECGRPWKKGDGY